MKVSVIIPCYNVEQYIAECIASVQHQSYRDIEIICVDDGSSDRTVEIIRSIIQSSSTSISLITQKNAGAPSARNRGVNASLGEYLQFLDADDILKPSKIERQIDRCKKENYPEIVVGSYQRLDASGEVIKTVEYSPLKAYDPWLLLMTTNFGNTCANLFKADRFREGMLWDETLKSSQEYDLMFRLLKEGATFIYDEDVNTIVRNRDTGSISQMNAKSKWLRYVQLRAQILAFCREMVVPNLDDLTQAMFIAIRFLYPHDPINALRIYKECIPRDFIPRVSPSLTNSYVQSFKLLGFKKTEQLKNVANTLNLR